ncbi:Peptidase inhibitor I78 family protein [Paracoccus halophilus]|mgnify:CR=1 FL=1|uniref:Peptidase inhibitor I78 family protein n=1 Tax=Paracoccus halophilus TaxID=376733 RepID=A0A099F9D9_9RHOB|nr:I78 family peptidase inhibitor [Paracoccus halophilus]KGJ06833.1 hypothetical protein IT41_01265 [Paracoccus halophilus]SFA41248.1 Peptidase inhibitor I78 family protein [Paracoccus halophilus]
MALSDKLPLILLLSALAACAQPEAQEPAAPSESDACGASRFQGLVGQPGAVLGDMTLPEGTRVVGPADPVTMDYRPSRLNMETGKDGRITRIACY